MATRKVFITGATGYLGRHLIPELLKRGHTIKALVREKSTSNLNFPCEIVKGDALNHNSFTNQISPCDTLIHLIGVAHPSPAKAKQFQEVDLVSIQEAVKAAQKSPIKHLIYVSVAHPSPIMKSYIEVRQTGEKLIKDSHLSATIFRPWYILGPGHWWPYILLPAYWILERIPTARETAKRLGLLTLEEMLKALVFAVENPAQGIRCLEVPEIKKIQDN
jgi:nucleoside-diphosphate-sugar epimerase